MTSPTVVWLRDDLRVADNPALQAAVERGGPVVVLYLHDDVTPGLRPIGAAAKWWLHHSLLSLDASLRERGARLTLRRGASAEVLPEVVAEVGAGAVHWNRRYARVPRELDAGIKTALHESGIDAHSHQGSLLFEPWTVRTGQGGPYRVFTPFWRACLDRPEPRAPLPAPDALTEPEGTWRSDALDDWGLLPTAPDWAGGLRDAWTPGEPAGLDRLEHFATEVLADYDQRDHPAQEATSHLSPRLRWGEVSPFQVWHRLRGDLPPAAREQAQPFLREVVWREFNHSVLYEADDLASVNLRREFDAFPWPEPDPDELRAWQQGRTGIPLVDAGMRELWTSGAMHNRVRMVTASFLVKNLLVDWRVGERWFWDCLVDADEANNPANWQWVAGSGADAAPYFRVFNPVLQQQKFDAHRDYVRHWVPEVDDESYPEPIVDLKESRRRALDAYETMRRS